MPSPTKLDAIVTRNSMLRQLFRDAGVVGETDTKIKALFPPPLRRRIYFATLRDTVLTISAESSAWAAKLRYEIPNVRRQIERSSEFSAIQTIRVRVAAREAPSTDKALTPMDPLSTNTAQALRQQAQSIVDTNIRDALLRIAERNKPSGE